MERCALAEICDMSIHQLLGWAVLPLRQEKRCPLGRFGANTTSDELNGS